MEDIIDCHQDPIPENGWRKWSAGMLDAMIVFVFCFPLYYLETDLLIFVMFSEVPFEVLVFMVFLLYRILLLVTFKKTIGMIVFRIQLLNGFNQPLTFWESFTAALFVMINGTDYFRNS